MSLELLLRPQICELGKVKIGAKEEKVRQTSGGREWRAPQKLDHFVVTTMQRNKAGDLIADTALMDHLRATGYADPDGHLRQLPITVLSDEPEDIMQSAYVWYGSKKIGARSDGETVTWYADPEKMNLLPEPRVEPWRPEMVNMKDRAGKPLFKLHTIVSFVIAAGQAKWGGVYKFRTTSRITADQLYGSLLHLRQLTGGILRGLPLVLVVRPMEVTPDGRSTTVYVVHVELHGADLKAVQQLAMQQAQWQLSNAKQMQSMQLEFRRLLTAPGVGETPAEIADVETEFHPEALAAESEVIPPSGADPLMAELVPDEIEQPVEPVAPEGREPGEEEA